ncbi:MAG: hypothetical protein H8E66_30900 [Planctomycetes bacterium]|nr:hypothetical protein [Planctomycetota bacterium]
MRSFDDPSQLTPDQQFRELASILAAGVLRLRKQQLLAGRSAEPTPETLEEIPRR